MLLLITDVLWPILEVIGSTAKPSLTLLFNQLAQARTVQERDECLIYIESILSAALRHFEQSSTAILLIAMLREGSLATINEVIALAAEHERLVQEPGQESGQERDGVPIAPNNVTGFDGFAIPLQIDTASEDGSAESAISMSSVTTEGSHGATELGQNGGQVATAPSVVASNQSMTNVESHSPSSTVSDGSGQSAISMSSVTIEESDQARHIELGQDGGQVSSSTAPSEVTSDHSMTDVNCAMSISSEATHASDHSLSDAA